MALIWVSGGVHCRVLLHPPTRMDSSLGPGYSPGVLHLLVHVALALLSRGSAAPTKATLSLNPDEELAFFFERVRNQPLVATLRQFSINDLFPKGRVPSVPDMRRVLRALMAVVDANGTLDVYVSRFEDLDSECDQLDAVWASNDRKGHERAAIELRARFESAWEQMLRTFEIDDENASDDHRARFSGWVESRRRRRR